MQQDDVSTDLVELFETINAAQDKTVIVVRKDTLLKMFSYIDLLSNKIVLLQKSIPKVYQKGLSEGKQCQDQQT